MFGLLGLLGALFAGVVAEAFTPNPDTSETDSDAPDDSSEAQDEDSQLGNIFSMLNSASAPSGDDQEDDAFVGSSDDQPASTEPLWLEGDDLNNILAGQAGDDSLFGGAGDDMIAGNAGNDSLSGGDGRDGLNGGAGDDSLYGFDDDDTLHGDDGNDLLIGGAGNDRLEACAGDDTLYGGDGNDVLIAGGGNDQMSGDAGDDAMIGCDDNDKMFGGTGSDTLDGWAGDDTLWGQDDLSDDHEVDFLNGSAGDDLLHLGSGDYGNGGDGADIFQLHNYGPDDAATQITDFNAADDRLIVLYDPAVHPDPQLSSQSTAAGTTLLLDGVAVANLQGAASLDLSHIELRAA